MNRVLIHVLLLLLHLHHLAYQLSSFRFPLHPQRWKLASRCQWLTEWYYYWRCRQSHKIYTSNVYLIRIGLSEVLISFQASNEVVNGIGNRWVVPWTAMTILQVSVSPKFEHNIITLNFSFVYQFLAVKI